MSTLMQPQRIPSARHLAGSKVTKVAPGVTTVSEVNDLCVAEEDVMSSSTFTEQIGNTHGIAIWGRSK